MIGGKAFRWQREKEQRWACARVSKPGSPVCLCWEHHWEHLVVGVGKALFEPQPAAFIWECLARPQHCSKAIREQSHPNLLFEDRSNSVCARGFWVPAGSSLLCCRARGGCSCPSVACLFSWAWSISGRRRWELRWLCWRVGGCVRKISFPTVHS